MGVTIPEGFGQATLVFQCSGVSQPMNVTFGFALDGFPEPYTTPDLVANAVRVATNAGQSIFAPARFSNEYVFSGVDVNINDGVTKIGSARLPTNGSVVGSSPMPPNCAVLVKKATAQGGRRHKGRMYLPPCLWGEGEVTAAGFTVITSSYTDVQTRLTWWLGELESSGFPMYVLHSPPETAPSIAPPPTKVTSLLLQPLIATQRRRLR
jgi:hypothetical protein